MHWRQIQKTSFTNWEKLANFLLLDEEKKKEILSFPPFPLLLPYRIAEKIEKNSLLDPLLLQFLPLQKEKEKTPGFSLHPVEDQSFQKTPKLLQKYEGRALLVTTSACAMNCRFCFRQNFPYEKSFPSFGREIEKIKDDPSLHEIILSGGDPLSLSNETLKELLDSLATIPHITKVRFHSRFIIGIPERIDEEFLALLKNFPKQIYFVIHSNHPKEYDEDIFIQLKKLQKIGVPILNQAVLLKGVNDSFATQKELCTLLTDRGILPYYLHSLDPVQGASHFAVSKEKGKKLIKQLQENLPGYAVPKYVEEIPHKKGKTPLLG